MKVGILTLPLKTNYGGILQCYALQTILEKMGHEVAVLDIDLGVYRLPAWKKPFAYGKRFLQKYITHTSTAPIRYEEAVESIQKKETIHTRQFIEKYIHVVAENNYHDLSPNNFDAIVVGSDQVWRPSYFPHTKGMSIKDAYLDFAKNWSLRRVAYAASFGTDTWEYSTSHEAQCKNLIKLFDGVSVREMSAIDLISRHFGRNSEFVLDPTLLLSESDYLSLIDEAEQSNILATYHPHKEFILNYVLDPSSQISKLLNKIGERKKLAVIVGKNVDINRETFDITDENKFIQPPVENWLRYFRDSEFVITDSFHACVFSIIFKKNFVAIGNVQRGMARFESLLGSLGLKDRLVNIDVDKINQTLDRPIDYGSVYEKLADLQDKSMQFLHRYL